MGSDKHEKPGSRKTASKKPDYGNFLVFRPNERQKEEIKNLNLTTEDCMNEFCRWSEEGHKFLWGYKAENGAHYIHIREGSADFGVAVTLSCWHSSYERALQMMVYALRGPYAEFPSVQAYLAGMAPDW